MFVKTKHVYWLSPVNHLHFCSSGATRHHNRRSPGSGSGSVGHPTNIQNSSAASSPLHTTFNNAASATLAGKILKYLETTFTNMDEASSVALPDK
jgi:hypothetical protein